MTISIDPSIRVRSKGKGNKLWKNKTELRRCKKSFSSENLRHKSTSISLVSGAFTLLLRSDRLPVNQLELN